MSLNKNIVTAALFYVFSFVFSMLIFIVSLIYGVIAKLLIKVQHPEAVFFSGVDSGLNYGTSNDEKLLLYSVLCNGSIDMDLFNSIIWEKGIKRNLRAQSFVEEKYGYYFWMKEKNFKFEDHVVYHPNLSISTKDQWKEVQNNLYYNTPMPKGFSPWVIHFVPLNPDYEESNENPSFFLVTMYFHCLCDGYSGMFTVHKAMSDQDEPRLMVSSIPTPTLSQQALIFLQSVFVLPYFVGEYFYKRSIFKQYAGTGRQIYVDSGKITTETVKIIKRSTRVPFFEILLSCMMGALQKFFIRSNREIPNEFTVCIPQVLWKREDKVSMKNNFFLVYMNLPFSQKVGVARLKEISAVLQSWYTRNLYISGYVSAKVLGSILPNFIGKFFYKNDHCSVLLSIAGMERYPRSVLGQRKLQTEPLNRMFNFMGNIGIIFQTVTFGDHISLSVHSRSTITTEEELEKVSKDFEEELQILMKDIS